MIELALASEQNTRGLGEWLARHCPAGSVVYLCGELGVGKTTLVRGFLRGLGYEGAVKSPTFTLVEPYTLGAQRVYHFDLYRVVSPEELDYLGPRDYFDDAAICLVEWPERGGKALPQADLVISLEYVGNSRRAGIESGSERGRQCIADLTQGTVLHGGT